MKIELLEKTFEQIIPKAVSFSASFYDTLFRSNPELKVLFANTSLEAQEKKLIFSLAAIIENLRNPEVLTPALQSLGARHLQVGTIEAHYPLVGQALLETFAVYLGSAWTEEAAEAWLGAYKVIANIMIEGAKHPEAHTETELTFYEWVDLYGESSPKVRKAITVLTEFRYGSRPDTARIEQL